MQMDEFLGQAIDYILTHLGGEIGLTKWAAVLFVGIVLYALYQRRDVKVGLKIPFAAFFFETMKRRDHPQPGETCGKRGHHMRR